MRTIIIGLFMCCYIGVVYAEVSSEPTPTKDDYKVARQFGYRNGKEIERLNKQLTKKIDINAINADIATAMERNQLEFAEQADIAIENLVSLAVVVLRQKGNLELADDIGYEFERYYQFGYTKQMLGIEEIGDHPPMNEWLDSVHNKIEDAIGNFLCEYFHFHDLYILNMGLPIVFNPKKVDLKDYLDHFSGHLIWGWFWEHHGVAGVITYWVVTGVCSGATSGMGLVTFACGPIAGMAEHVMDKRIAPPIATRIWERYN